MSDFTPLKDITAGEATPQPAIGDVWVDRQSKQRAWVADVIPFDGHPVVRVCLELVGEQREWLSVAELRERFLFRRRA